MINIKEIDDIQEHEISKLQWSDFKTITKFLWFPKTINGETKWFKTASWQEQFVEEFDEFYDCFFWTWKSIKWL